MLGFSFTEIILLAVIALVVIGPKQLPEVARNIGRFLNELKRTSNAFTREFRENMDQVKIDPIRFDEPKAETPPPTSPNPETVTPATFTSEVMSPQFPLSSSTQDVSHSEWTPKPGDHSGLAQTETTKKENGSHD